jgi:crotonobetainyl-CoA:carnitine CoA-transferase CaiB-like acyl-CoA transferase
MTAGDELAPQRGPDLRRVLAERLAMRDGGEWERLLNDAGVPAARVRTLREFTQEAVASGLLQPQVLGDGPARALTPGLGWRARY